MSNIEEYTKNFKFMIPEFNVATWHTEIKENFKAIDALIANFVQSQQYKGAWKQVTSYIINDLVYISDEDSDYYGYLMRVKVNHTTTGDDFDTFLANNPTYYEVQGEMGAQLAALRAQDWAEKTDGIVVINESPVDYSSKAYAIGGTGTETNNSKYFKEQAELARDTILEDPGFIAIKTDFLGDETIKTVAENIQHVQNVDTNIQSIIDVSTNITNVNTLAPNIAAILTNATNISSINTNATNISNINTISSNMSDINNCSTNMNAIQAAPTQAANAAQSAQLAQEAALSITNGYDLLDHKWSDHLLNDQNWLRADTFSWQPATTQDGTYLEAYNHLVDDVNGKTTSNSDTIGSYTIYYVLADDGHKIVGPDQEATVNNIYNESGVAWYYILDKTNQRFKLPRENPAREELIQIIRAKGNDTAIGFTDGTNNFGLRNRGVSGSNGFLYLNKLVYGGTLGNSDSNVQNANAPGSDLFLGVTTDSTKSGIISDMTDSTSVYKGKKYLYFYVGQFSQTATEQTAGLNSELFNGKLDIDLRNASSTTKETMVGWGNPDYTSGVSISTSGYTFQNNGFCRVSIVSSPNTDNSTGRAYVNDVLVAENRHTGGGVGLQLEETFIFQVSKNDVLTYEANVHDVVFFPLKGVTNA